MVKYSPLLTPTQYLIGCSKSDIPKFIILSLTGKHDDGFPFLREYLKKIYPLYPHIPITIISSAIHEKNITRYLCYPFIKGHIPKPLNQSSLNQIAV